MKTDKTGRHRLINIGIALISIAICLIAAEAVVHKIIPMDKGKSYEFRIPHPVLGWSLQPNAAYHNALPEENIYIKYNSIGYHDVEHSINKPKNVFRILLLGDSYMEAYSVNLKDSFARRLEEFAEKQGLKVEVISLGAGGYGTLQEYLAFNLTGKQYNPDLVLLGFYSNNDLVENSMELSSVTEKTKKRPFLDPGYPDEWKITGIDFADSQRRYAEAKKHLNTIPYKLMSKSILLKLLYKEYRRTVLRMSEDRDDSVPLDKDSLDLISQGVFYCVEPPEYTRAWNTTKRILSQLKKDVESAGSRLIVFSVPSLVETNKLAEDSTRLCIEQPPAYKRLAEILEEQQTDYINLFPVFRKETREKGLNLFRQSDRHWNPEGHLLAARQVISYLTEKGIFESRTVRK